MLLFGAVDLLFVGGEKFRRGKNDGGRRAKAAFEISVGVAFGEEEEAALLLFTRE